MAEAARRVLVLLAVVWLLGAATEAAAQDIEPREFSNAPVGMNFLLVGFADTQGGASFDTALPIRNPQLETDSAVVGYVRALDIWGLSGKVDAIVPYSWLSGSASYAGETVHRAVAGFANPLLRVSVNLYGAPALDAKDFATYRQDLIVGASLQISAPLGQYDETRLVNIGTNRWFFKSSIGLSKAVGPWTLEATAAATFYTDNSSFYGGTTRSQDPLYAAQWHVIRTFRPGLWGSLDATYFAGGRTTVEGVLNNDLQRNWRAGATLSMALDKQNSLKFYASHGVSARTGNNYDLFGLAWQYRWGAGL
jgi:hypothetical protein